MSFEKSDGSDLSQLKKVALGKDEDMIASDTQRDYAKSIDSWALDAATIAKFTNNDCKLYLASASQRRKDLLEQIAVFPDHIISADIDEKQAKGESVREMTARLANEKAAAVAPQVKDGYVLAADTAIEIGGKAMGKALHAQDVSKMLSRLSGRKHRVYSSVVLLKIQENKIVRAACKISKTTVALKAISVAELNEYVASGLGIGREGGFNIQTHLEAFVKSIDGSYSGIIGLPLYETNNILISLGYKNTR